MARPKVSVITAVYNGRTTIESCIDSVLAQDYPDIEYIVIDGASKDGTTECVRGYGNKIQTFISEPDGGIYDALNKGIARASGDVVGFLHADDLFSGNNVLARVAEAFADPAVDAVYGDLVYVSKMEPDRVIRYWKSGDFDPQKLHRGWMPPHPTFYVRREIYERLGAFDTSFRIAADYDCMLRILSSDHIRCHYIPEVLVNMRVGGASNRSLKNILRKSAEDYRALRHNGVGGIGTLLWKNFSKLPQFVSRKGSEKASR